MILNEFNLACLSGQSYLHPLVRLKNEKSCGFSRNQLAHRNLKSSRRNYDKVATNISNSFIASWIDLATGIVWNKGLGGLPIKDPASIANFIAILRVARCQDCSQEMNQFRPNLSFILLWFWVKYDKVVHKFRLRFKIFFWESLSSLNLCDNVLMDHHHNASNHHCHHVLSF